MVQVQHTLFSALCQAIGQGATQACVVTGNADLVGDLVAGAVVNGLAISVGVAIGLVCRENPVVWRQCHGWRINYFQDSGDYGSGLGVKLFNIVHDDRLCANNDTIVTAKVSLMTLIARFASSNL